MRRRNWRARLGSLLALLAFALLLSGPPRAGLRLALLGDLMLGRGVSAAQAAHPGDDPLALLAAELNTADLGFANLESPLTAMPLLDPSGYDLRADPAQAAVLAAAGLDVLSLANNHSLDSGLQGLADTRAALAANGLLRVAAGDPPLRIEVEGLELAVLSYEAVMQPLDLQAIAADVRREKARGTLVLVSLHWGGEFRPAADPAQRAAARSLAQAGADLIWGHHPHVLQPVEWLERPSPWRPCLAVYSLGNALFDQQAPPEARWGALLLASLDARGVKSVELRPFEIDLPAGALHEADSQTAAKIRERLNLP